MPARIYLLAVLLLSAARLPAAPAAWELALETAWDDNLSGTPAAMGSPASGMYTQVAAAMRKVGIVSEQLSVMAQGGANYHAFHIDESADYWSVNAALAANYRPFAGFSAPGFKASLMLRRKDYNNAFAPDWYYRVRLAMDYRLSPALSTELGLAHRAGYDEWSQVDTLNRGYWDTREHEIYASGDLRLQRLTLYGKLAYASGDKIWARPVTGGYQSALWEDADTLSLDLGVNLPLSGQAALDLLARYADVENQGMQMYTQRSLSLAYIRRFAL